MRARHARYQDPLRLVTLTAGLLLALASAIAINWGFFVQHGASAALPRLSLRRPLRSLRLLFTDLRWLGGYAAGMGGWALYVVALRFAPLSLVQAVSAAGIAVLALLVHRTAGGKLSRRERTAVIASLGGLALLVVSFAGGFPHGHAHTLQVLLWVGVTLAVAAVAAWPAAPLLRPGAGLGAAAGLLYAAGDVSTKGAVSGLTLVLVPLLLACLVVAFVALQLAFQRGTALATAGLSTLLNNSLPILAGIVLFGERLPAGVLGAARAAAFLLLVVASALLARREQDAVPQDHMKTPGSAD